MEIVSLAIAMTVGLTEAIKRTNILSDRYTALVSLFIGILVSLLANKGISFEIVFSGIIVGLSASGLWSGVKHTMKK